MDIITIVLSVLLLIIIFFIIRSDPERTRVRVILEKVPGPPTYPIFGNAWELITSPMYRYVEIYRKRNMCYGPIYRTWNGPSGEICLNTAETAEVILSNSEHIDKSKEYLMLKPWLGDCLFLKQGKEWRTFRKLVAPGFSSSIQDNYFDVFKNSSEILVQKLAVKVDKGEFDVCPYLARFTLDIICETVGGIKVDAQNDNNMMYVNAVHDIIEIITKRHTTPWYMLDFIFRRSKIGIRYKECVEIIHKFIDKIIQDRLKYKDESLGKNSDITEDVLYDSEVRRKNMDWLGIFLEKISTRELRQSIDALVFAGHDTTYSGLSWAIQLLGDYTDVQEKVYEELESIFQGSDRPPVKQDLQDMKYLERVIKETLRLYPSAPSIGRQTRKDVQIGQYTIPAGVSVWIQIFFLHRNPKYYANPEEFNPDNFLPERIRDRHPYAFLPFSAGPRSCMGQKYAIMEMKTTLSNIIRRFKIRSIIKTKDLPPVYGVTLTVHGGVHIELTLRDKKL